MSEAQGLHLDAMKLGVFTAIVLRHPSEDAALLLRRSAGKKRFPGLITGIGGQVELTQGEGEDLGASLLREFQEETKIPLEIVTDVRCRLSTLITRGDLQVLLLWFTGRLTAMPDDLSCTEGHLEFFDVNASAVRADDPHRAAGSPVHPRAAG